MLWCFFYPSLVQRKKKSSNSYLREGERPKAGPFAGWLGWGLGRPDLMTREHWRRWRIHRGMGLRHLGRHHLRKRGSNICLWSDRRKWGHKKTVSAVIWYDDIPLRRIALAKVEWLVCGALRFSFETQGTTVANLFLTAGWPFNSVQKKCVYREAQKDHKHELLLLVNKCHE